MHSPATTLPKKPAITADLQPDPGTLQEIRNRTGNQSIQAQFLIDRGWSAIAVFCDDDAEYRVWIPPTARSLIVETNPANAALAVNQTTQ